MYPAFDSLLIVSCVALLYFLNFDRHCEERSNLLSCVYTLFMLCQEIASAASQ